ncbi:MAG: lipid-A-disaccharide synthase [Opitutaceae bacterium]|jgi:lipid A disaccharide synthetase|nr:lipid-A-disaccharide synthase [Opitutaceae bacterium]
MSAPAALPFRLPAPRTSRVDLLIIAGEHSGDQHAARMVRELLARDHGKNLSVCALGGPDLASAGAQLLHDMTATSVIGLVEVLKNFSFFNALFNEVLRWVGAYKPRAVCFVDYPGMNLRLAKEMRKRGLSAKGGGPVRALFYISPQIWAWKAGRRFKMARDLDAMAVIFPFEPACYDDTALRGKVEFVGHPFVAGDYAAPVTHDVSGPILLLPGSRKQAVTRIFPLMLAGYERYCRATDRQPVDGETANNNSQPHGQTIHAAAQPRELTPHAAIQPAAQPHELTPHAALQPAAQPRELTLHAAIQPRVQPRIQPRELTARAAQPTTAQPVTTQPATTQPATARLAAARPAIVLYPSENVLSVLRTFTLPAGIELRPTGAPVAASAVLTSSGTMSMHCALAGIPGAIVYRVNPITYLFGRLLVKVPHIGIANLLLKEPMYPEHIQGAASPEALAGQLRDCLENPARLAHTESCAARLRAILHQPTTGTAADWLARQLA